MAGLKEKILSYTLAAGLTFLGGCSSFPINEILLPKKSDQEKRVEKYALLVSAISEWNSDYSSGSKDYDSYALFKIYQTLIRTGFKDKNIFILYGAFSRTPNFDCGVYKSIAKRMKEKHFSQDRNTSASEKNIESVIHALKNRLDGNDKFVFYLLGHGNEDGSVELETLFESLSISNLQNYITGWKSSSNWFLFNNCYSGNTLEKLKLDNVCLFAASEKDKPAWVSRSWSSSAVFLSNKADRFNDSNSDGIVDWEEAYEATKKDVEEYLNSYSFLKEDLEDIKNALKPVIKVGKNFKKASLR